MKLDCQNERPTETPATQARKHILAIELDENEMACRILEVFFGVSRPVGATAAQALAAVGDIGRDAGRAAAVAIRYLHEQINAGQSVS